MGSKFCVDTVKKFPCSYISTTILALQNWNPSYFVTNFLAGVGFFLVEVSYVTSIMNNVSVEASHDMQIGH